MSGMRMSVISTSGRPCRKRPKNSSPASNARGEHVGLLQRLLEHPAHRLVVVDDPHGSSPAWPSVAPSVGNWQTDLKTVRPGSLVNSMSPPLRLTRSCAIVRPSPVPVGRPVTSG